MATLQKLRCVVITLRTNSKSKQIAKILRRRGESWKLIPKVVQNHHAASSVHFCNPSFSLAWRTVLSTVRHEMPSSSAISFWEAPHATNCTTCSSRCPNFRLSAIIGYFFPAILYTVFGKNRIHTEIHVQPGIETEILVNNPSVCFWLNPHGQTQCVPDTFSLRNRQTFVSLSKRVAFFRHCCFFLNHLTLHLIILGTKIKHIWDNHKKYLK